MQLTSCKGYNILYLEANLGWSSAAKTVHSPNLAECETLQTVPARAKKLQTLTLLPCEDCIQIHCPS